ncbi:VWA domain-containing protein [Paraflavitalea pollutisoli]|uniref:VWA domain-containing protein n=1 Tax=Paraflavitalea pollutisoli TaxID=3034143 RepID=UPI0023EC3271|nr:VWA domain-containing protein [Paraflavitalea sp. H1-2-19X]
MHFEIAYKWIFLLLPLPLLVYWLLPAWRKKRAALLVPFFDRAAKASGQRPAQSAWITGRSWINWTTLFLCWILLLGAAASPRYVGQPGKRVKTVRSFLIAADISFSMAQTDWVLHGKRTSRWDAVKTIMKDFVQHRQSDQIGLVMFGTHAYLQAPLTTDLGAINWLLDQTEVGMAGQMTSIGEAIGFSIKIFREDTIKQKIMLLLTDGLDAGQQLQPLDAAQQARKDSIIIYTLGIGKAKGSGGYDLDEKTLQQIAHITGGQYFNAMNEGQLKEVYKALDRLQPIQFEEETYKPVKLLYMYPLAWALALGLVFHLLNGLVQVIRWN